VKRYLLLALAWISFTLGFIGIFIPVLPTTPFMLLATFLFAKSSPRLHAWIQTTRVYRHYVVPFKDAGGIPLGTKIRILAISYVVMGISAWFVQLWFVWVILGMVALFLLYLMFIRIPTITVEEAEIARKAKEPA